MLSSLVKLICAARRSQCIVYYESTLMIEEGPETRGEMTVTKDLATRRGELSEKTGGRGGRVEVARLRRGKEEKGMKLLVSVLALFGSASALVVGTAGTSASQRVAMSPMMACNGGKGGRGGMAPPKDKMRRGRVKALIQAVRHRRISNLARPHTAYFKLAFRDVGSCSTTLDRL